MPLNPLVQGRVEMHRINKVSDCLTRLAGFCDTGFALAVHIRYTRPTLLYQTYAQDWIDFYSEKGLMLSDPVVRWGLVNTGRIDWHEVADDDPAQVIASAAEHGLHNGVTLSIGPESSRTIAGLTRSDRPFTAGEIDEMQEIITEIHDLTEDLDSLSPSDLERLRNAHPDRA